MHCRRVHRVLHGNDDLDGSGPSCCPPGTSAALNIRFIVNQDAVSFTADVACCRLSVIYATAWKKYWPCLQMEGTRMAPVAASVSS